MTHILIVEDERAMCEALSLDLTERGYDVTWKLSGEEAIQFLKESEVYAVVTDLNMKGMSGVELCDRIVSNRPEIPVIVITAFGSLETAVQTIRAGAFDFVKKPFDLEELLVAIERAIQLSRDKYCSVWHSLRQDIAFTPGEVVSQRGSFVIDSNSGRPPSTGTRHMPPSSRSALPMVVK